MSACDDDDGRPKYQVARFHAIAPTSAAKTKTKPVVAFRGRDDALADSPGHAGRDQGADEVEARCHCQRDAR